MSKAFTREDDSAETEMVVLIPRTPLPPGVKNYTTQEGFARLQERLKRLSEKRTTIASNKDALTGSSATSDLQKLDVQITQMQEILSTAVVTGSPSDGRDQVRFGAKVRVEDQKKEKDNYQIVGVDETDLAEGRISWLSPLARALHLHRAGDVVRFRTPAGFRELTIISVEYD